MDDRFPPARAKGPDPLTALKQELYRQRDNPEALEAYRLLESDEAWGRLVLGLLKRLEHYQDQIRLFEARVRASRGA